MHRKRNEEVSRHSAEDRTTEFGCMRGDARAAVQERKRAGTREVSPRTTTTLVVLVESRRREEQTEQLSAEDSGEQKIDEKRTKSFHEARRTRTHEYSQQAVTRETYAAQRR